MRQATCTSNECEPEDRRKLASWIYERQQVYWPVASRSRLRSLSSFSLVIRGQASDNHRSVTELSRGRPSPSVAHTPWERRAKGQNARSQRRQMCACAKLVAACSSGGRVHRISQAAQAIDVTAQRASGDIETPGKIGARPIALRLKKRQQTKQPG